MSLRVVPRKAMPRTQLRCPAREVLRALASSQRWMELSCALAKTNRPAGSNRHDRRGLLCRNSWTMRVRTGLTRPRPDQGTREAGKILTPGPPECGSRWDRPSEWAGHQHNDFGWDSVRGPGNTYGTGARREPGDRP